MPNDHGPSQSLSNSIGMVYGSRLGQKETMGFFGQFGTKRILEGLKLTKILTQIVMCVI
jgi:hypothetical protein